MRQREIFFQDGRRQENPSRSERYETHYWPHIQIVDTAIFVPQMLVKEQEQKLENKTFKTFNT